MSEKFNAEARSVGNTPLVRLFAFSEAMDLPFLLYGKLEKENPAGSSKDRVALSILDAAERDGKLVPGATVIEPTSGNTGIALAAFGVARGYRVILVMPETASKERIDLMHAYGAEVVLTQGSLGMSGAIARAAELEKEIPGAFVAGQFKNPENPLAHYRTTGPEIWRDTNGAVDVFVAGIGTGGTVSGVSRYLKERKQEVFVLGVEPADSAVLTGGTAGPHALQGIGAGFVPETLDLSLVDEITPVTKEEAYLCARTLLKTEGLSVGISSGAALAAAVKLSERAKDQTVVVLLPDGGERYLSTDLFQE